MRLPELGIVETCDASGGSCVTNLVGVAGNSGNSCHPGGDLQAGGRLDRFHQSSPKKRKPLKMSGRLGLESITYRTNPLKNERFSRRDTVWTGPRFFLSDRPGT